MQKWSISLKQLFKIMCGHQQQKELVLDELAVCEAELPYVGRRSSVNANSTADGRMC